MRILITGPECSGKSTLAKALSEQLSIPWFPEYARTYLEAKGKNYQQEDIVKIAMKHFDLVNVFPASQPLILDTYLLNLKLWSEIKYNKSIPWIDEKLVGMKPFDFILLMSPDLPWKQDGYRESPTELDMIFERCKLELDNLEYRYSIVSGQGELRLNSALNYINLSSNIE